MYKGLRIQNPYLYDVVVADAARDEVASITIMRPSRQNSFSRDHYGNRGS